LRYLADLEHFGGRVLTHWLWPRISGLSKSSSSRWDYRTAWASSAWSSCSRKVPF
jgi:hypothetical protein